MEGGSTLYLSRSKVEILHSSWPVFLFLFCGGVCSCLGVGGCKKQLFATIPTVVHCFLPVFLLCVGFCSCFGNFIFAAIPTVVKDMALAQKSGSGNMDQNQRFAPSV